MDSAVLTPEALPQRKKTRDFGLDLLRALAIFGVVLVHTSSDGYYTEVGCLNWWGSMFWSLFCRRNVVLFLMCSGAVLLQPEKPLTLRKLFLHNIPRLLISLLFWAMFYKVQLLIDAHGLNARNLWQAFKEVLTFNHMWHLYYMDIMLLVYLWLPVTRILTEKATKKQLHYALALWFALGIVYPTVKPFWPFTLLQGMVGSQWLLNMTYASIGYGLLGWYLRTYPLSVRKSIIVMLAGFLFTADGTIIQSFRLGYSYQGFIEEMTVGPCLMGAGLYALCLHVKKAPNKVIGFIVEQLSRGSLCIYCVHVIFLDKLPRCLAWPGVSTFISIPAQAIITTALCWIIYFILSKIPVLKKWIV